MLDFLTFDWFVAPYALPVFYYLGAIGIPVGCWFAMLWLGRRFPTARQAAMAGQRSVWLVLSPRQRGYVLLGFLTGFLLMELFWRMLFEYLIAFLQIHEALTASPPAR